MFAGRYVVELADEQGSLIGYVGRSVDGGEPKYIFPPGERGFHKSHLLFNLHRAVKAWGIEHPVILVEGVFISVPARVASRGRRRFEIATCDLKKN